MQETIRGIQETIMCEYCLSILLPDGDCPYCGRHWDGEDEEEP